MKSKLAICLFLLFLTSLACASIGSSVSSTPHAIPSLAVSPFDTKETVFGFFPSPPEASQESIIAHYKLLGEHADIVLLQQNIPWNDFETSPDAPSQAITDIQNQVVLAHQNGLDVIFVVDPLNGLNRREFFNLPMGWNASFEDERVRSAFTNFSLRILRQFQPKYLGLASEINTYADAYPRDFDHFLSLYRETYQQIKNENPDTQVFVTFQWEDLNNMSDFFSEGRQAYQTNWETVESFEPNLDCWVISSYPWVVFSSAAEIPPDYYTPLLEHTDKPIAVAEGGYTSQIVNTIPGSEQDQVDYLNAIHAQLGSRLDFWVYLLLKDINIDSYASIMRENGISEENIETLSMFAFNGLIDANGNPKPALQVWDTYRLESVQGE